MNLITRIKADQLTARKAGDKSTASILTTLYSEAAQKGFDDGKRDSTDAEVIATCKKFISNINETLGVTFSEELTHELKIVELYLPVQMTGTQIHDAVIEIKHGLVASGVPINMKSMGLFMKEFIAKYEGTYDGTIASKTVRDVINDS